MEWPKGLQISLNASVNQSGAWDKSSPVGFYEIVKGFNIKESQASMKQPNGIQTSQGLRIKVRPQASVN